VTLPGAGVLGLDGDEPTEVVDRAVGTGYRNPMESLRPSTRPPSAFVSRPRSTQHTPRSGEYLVCVEHSAIGSERPWVGQKAGRDIALRTSQATKVPTSEWGAIALGPFRWRRQRRRLHILGTGKCRFRRQQGPHHCVSLILDSTGRFAVYSQSVTGSGGGSGAKRK
jgi:hypothetical protein